MCMFNFNTIDSMKYITLNLRDYAKNGFKSIINLGHIIICDDQFSSTRSNHKDQPISTYGQDF